MQSQNNDMCNLWLKDLRKYGMFFAQETLQLKKQISKRFLILVVLFKI